MNRTFQLLVTGGGEENGSKKEHHETRCKMTDCNESDISDKRQAAPKEGRTRSREGRIPGHSKYAGSSKYVNSHTSVISCEANSITRRSQPFILVI